MGFHQTISRLRDNEAKHIPASHLTKPENSGLQFNSNASNKIKLQHVAHLILYLNDIDIDAETRDRNIACPLLAGNTPKIVFLLWNCCVNFERCEPGQNNVTDNYGVSIVFVVTPVNERNRVISMRDEIINSVSVTDVNIRASNVIGNNISRTIRHDDNSNNNADDSPLLLPANFHDFASCSCDADHEPEMPNQYVRILKKPEPFVPYVKPARYRTIPPNSYLPKFTRNIVPKPWGVLMKYDRKPPGLTKFPLPPLKYPYIFMSQAIFKHYEMKNER